MAGRGLTEAISILLVARVLLQLLFRSLDGLTTLDEPVIHKADLLGARHIDSHCVLSNPGLYIADYIAGDLVTISVLDPDSRAGACLSFFLKLTLYRIPCDLRIHGPCQPDSAAAYIHRDDVVCYGYTAAAPVSLWHAASLLLEFLAEKPDPVVRIVVAFAIGAAVDGNRVVIDLIIQLLWRIAGTGRLGRFIKILMAAFGGCAKNATSAIADLVVIYR